MKEKILLKKSGYITIGILIGISIFWFLFSIQTSFGYSPDGASLDIKNGSRINIGSGIDALYIQPGSGTTASDAEARIYFGTESCRGSGTVGYILSGTLTGLPFLKYRYSNGSSTIDFLDFDHVTIDGVDIPSAGSMTGKINSVEGTGTTNVFTDTTLAGQGTFTVTFRANGLDITPEEYSAVDGSIGPLQAQITTATGSITNHTHTGSDGTTQIAHNDVTGSGSTSHATLDTFYNSKGQASGIASLDTNSLVVQNPASGTSTPGASKIIMSDGTGKTSDGWLSDNVTKIGTPTTDNIPEGSTNKYYTDVRVNTAVGSLSVSSFSDTAGLGSATEGQYARIIGGQWGGAASSVLTYWGDILGNPASGTTASSYVSSTPAANKIPYSVDGTLGTWINALANVTMSGNTTYPGDSVWNSSGYISIGSSTLSSGDLFQLFAGGVASGRIKSAGGHPAGLYYDAGAGKDAWMVGNHMNYVSGYSVWNVTDSLIRLNINDSGIVSMPVYGAGSAQFDANGIISSSSDERLKDIQGTFTASIKEILNIVPIQYRYNNISGLDTKNVYTGFSAQNVVSIIPEAIGIDPLGYYTLNDRAIIAALVNCVKDLQAEIDDLKGIATGKAKPLTKEEYKNRLLMTNNLVLENVPLEEPVSDTHEYVVEGVEIDLLGINKVDAFEEIDIMEEYQTGTITKEYYKLDGMEVIKCEKSIPIYQKRPSGKKQTKLKDNVVFDSELGHFFEKVEVPKLVYQIKAGYSYKAGKYYRKETLKEANSRIKNAM